MKTKKYIDTIYFRVSVPYSDKEFYIKTKEEAKRWWLSEDTEQPNGIEFYSMKNCNKIYYTYDEVKNMSYETILEKNVISLIKPYDNICPMPRFIPRPCCFSFIEYVN